MVAPQETANVATSSLTIGPAPLTYSEAPVYNANLAQAQSDYMQQLQTISQER